MLEELPGVSDVVWATVTRLASARVPTRVFIGAAEKQAGTSVLASATAIGLAQYMRLPVCLVETNVRRPALAGYLGLEPAGLSDILDGRAELEDCLQELRDCPGLAVLPAGTPRAPVPGEFKSDRMISTLAQLEQRCHYLILDAAPVLETVEVRQLLRHSDGALLVLRAQGTCRSDAERAHDILLESGTPVIGSIFNDFRSPSLFGSRRADRSFERAVAAERPRTVFAFPPPRGETGSRPTGETQAENGNVAAVTNGGPHASNGSPRVTASQRASDASEADYLRRIDILERRIVKLTQLLGQTEADLQRIAAMKNVDLGVASMFRSVEGLSAGDEALAFKRLLLREIFQSNLELKTVMARHS
jgi:Mrp family chromosome partitioning ATPase